MGLLIRMPLIVSDCGDSQAQISYEISISDFVLAFKLFIIASSALGGLLNSQRSDFSDLTI